MLASINLARAITLGLAAVSLAVPAAQLDYTLYTGAEHSDNVNLASTHPVAQSTLIPGVNFTFVQNGSRFQANLAGTLEYRDYLGSDFSNQMRALFAGQAAWTILPQRLDLTVEDYAGIQPVDQLASKSPSNLQQTNVAKIGPTLYFHPGDALRGQVDLRYIDSRAEKSKNFDSARGLAALHIFRDIDPLSVLSANAQVQHVHFPSAVTSDYDRSEVFAGYVSKLAHLDVDAALGWSRLDFRTAGQPSIASPMVRMAVDWRVSERSTFTLAGSRQYSDSALDMSQPRNATPGNAIEGGNATVNSLVYLERRVGVSYVLHTERMSLSVAPAWLRLSYSNDPTFNQIGRGGIVGIDYRLRPTLTLAVLATSEQLTYQSIDRRDRTTSCEISLAQQWNTHWGWRASMLRERRNSNAANQGFRENRIYFGVSYKR